MGNEALGNLKRNSTSLRLPTVLTRRVKPVIELLDIGKNAFFTMAGYYYLGLLSPFLVGTKRKILLDNIEKEFTDMLKRMREVP